MKFKIESDVPIPEIDRKIYPFKQMKVGDSFGVPFRKKRTSAVRTACSMENARNKDREFIARIDNEKYQTRVWRIK